MLKKSKFETTIYMPKQLVIYIEKHQDIKDELRLRIVYPDGDEKVYTVPVMKYWEFETSDLMEQKMYPLLPLQVFKLRRKLKHIKEQKHNSEQMQEILQEVMQTAKEVGKASVCLYNEKIVTGEDLHKILTALGNLVRYLTSKYGNIEHINEEVEIMLKTLYDPVVEEKGIEKGIEKGKEEGLRENIQYLLADLADFNEYKERLDDQLKLIKDVSKLKELLKASARVTSVKEFMQHF